jgi:hypothetical protein
MTRTLRHCLAIAALFARLIARTFWGRRRPSQPDRFTDDDIRNGTLNRALWLHAYQNQEGGPHAE